jgi:HEAT repeat protein
MTRSPAAVALAVLVALLAGALAPAARAHGGMYVGPAGAGWAPGGMVAAPTGASGAPSGPSGAGATTGTAPSPMGAKKALSSGGSPADTSVAGWQYWWEFNKDRYLDLKSRGNRLASRGGSPGHLTGRGRRADPDLFIRPDPTLIRSEVLPLLLRLLDEEQDRDILDSAMLALARSADESTAQFVVDAVTPFLAHPERGVRCAATLSLGVLHSPRAIPTLSQILRDSSKGRALAHATGPLDQSMRACAAIGLGLIDEPDSVDELCHLIDATKDSDDDLKGCAIAALGLMDNQAGTQALTFLLGLLADPQLDPPIKSQVPIAVGRLCERMGLADPAVEQALLEAFTDRDTDARVRESLAVALGLVGEVRSDDMAQNPVLLALLTDCAAGRDDGTRELCFVAAAEVGRRDGAASEHPRVHQALRELFVKQCVSPSVAGDRAWSALGAAIYGQERAEAQAPLAEALTEAWTNEGDPSFKGAFALALGLLDERGRGGELYDSFRKQQDQQLNGFTALSLGFLGFTEASDALRDAAQAKTIVPVYRMRLATSLALLADDGADEALIALLEQGHAVGVNAAAAKSLGLIGGVPALRTLSGLAADAHQPATVRAFACVAIGMICEKTALPWNARLSADSNFRSLVPTLREVLDIL